MFDKILLSASLWYNWQQRPESTITVEDTVLFWNGVLAAFWDDTACAAGGGYPTPYWDEISDVEDEEPADLQTWYGEVTEPNANPDEMTFVENAFIWTITGFIVYSGQIGAAIAFNTIAKRWVLAWRKGDVREVFRVIVDAADAGEIDTDDYDAGDLIEMQIIGDPALSTHDILIVRTL